MSDAANIRRERIERLLQELRYEVTRGIMEREIEEEMGFAFKVPVSRHFPDGFVGCEFRTRPYPGLRYQMHEEPRLRIVKPASEPPGDSQAKQSTV